MLKLSFSDILLITEFKSLKEFDLLPIDMDVKVLPYLHILGFDTKQGYYVVADKHRNKQNKIIVGFSYMGQIRQDSEFKHSSLCSAEDRIIMTGATDITLTNELCKLSGCSGSSVIGLQEDAEEDDTYARDMWEEDYDVVLKQINALNSIVKFVRGSPYNDSGSFKTHQQWIEGSKKDSK